MCIAVIAEQFLVRSETFVHSLVMGLLRLGHDVQVFANPPPGQRIDLRPLDGLEGRIRHLPWCPPAL